MINLYLNRDELLLQNIVIFSRKHSTISYRCLMVTYILSGGQCEWDSNLDQIK